MEVALTTPLVSARLVGSAPTAAASVLAVWTTFAAVGASVETVPRAMANAHAPLATVTVDETAAIVIWLTGVPTATRHVLEL